MSTVNVSIQIDQQTGHQVDPCGIDCPTVAEAIAKVTRKARTCSAISVGVNHATKDSTITLYEPAGEFTPHYYSGSEVLGEAAGIRLGVFLVWCHGLVWGLSVTGSGKA